MATAVETSKRTLEAEQRVVLPNVGWEGYEALLRMVGDGHTRITYDRGDAELARPASDVPGSGDCFSSARMRGRALG